MAGTRRRRDVNWGREEPQCLGGEGALFAERRQRERGREGVRVVQEKHPPKPPTGESREKRTITSFCKQRSSHSEGLEVCTIPGSRAGQMGAGGRRRLATACQVGIPGGVLGENLPSQSTSGRGQMASPRTKDLGAHLSGRSTAGDRGAR